MSIRLMKKAFKIFLWIIVVLLFIVFILPGFLTGLQRGKQIFTLNQMKEISDAIVQYEKKNSKIPKAKTIKDLIKILQPLSKSKLSLKDGWGNYFHYSYKSISNEEKYFLGSGGRDGIFLGFSQKGTYIVKTIKNYDNDIVLFNGNLEYYPLTSYRTNWKNE